MIDKASILKMTKHAFKRGQGVPDTRIMHPRREWMTGLLIFIIIVLAGSFVSSQLYITYNTIDTEEVITDTTVVRYNELAVTNAAELFAARSEVYEALTARAVVFDVTPEPELAEAEEESEAGTTTSEAVPTSNEPTEAVPEEGETDLSPQFQ